MSVDKTQLQRFEMKYLVSEEKAAALRNFIRSYLRPDDFAATLPQCSYPVHTLYLDSPDLATYQAVQHGERNRFKLRLRYYDENPASPVFFEIKKRINDCIAKERAKIRRDRVAGLLAGEPPQLSDLVRPDAKQFFALQNFCRLMHKLGASPRSHVAYRREAWMSPCNNSMRVTFDRQVQCSPEFSASLSTDVGGAITAFDQVIVELKFVDRLPNWCLEMIRVFSLRRSGAPKYVRGVELLGEAAVSNRGVNLKVPAVVPASSRWVSAEPLAVAAA